MTGANQCLPHANVRVQFQRIARGRLIGEDGRASDLILTRSVIKNHLQQAGDLYWTVICVLNLCNLCPFITRNISAAISTVTVTADNCASGTATYYDVRKDVRHWQVLH